MRYIMSLFSLMCTTMLCAEPQLDAKIHEHGHAEFSMPGRDNAVLWVVSCNRPMRDCVVRSSNTILRIVDDQPSLLFFAPGSKGALVMSTNRTEFWESARFSRLSPIDIELLTQPDTLLSVSGRFGPKEFFRLNGIEQVIGYLKWQKTDTARALRDARYWPGDGPIEPNELDEVARMRLTELDRRRQLRVPTLGGQLGLIELPNLDN